MVEGHRANRGDRAARMKRRGEVWSETKGWGRVVPVVAWCGEGQCRKGLKGDDYTTKSNGTNCRLR